ncbi:unnamed protein product [Clonostachys byssicola]|uniref:Zn(2)-C6 fungal-type domain-containing protein n=1 Tax=Clonostachys byssicola TaxID=160290 RepID=A0A9N9UNJ3_9HYPO|nr:unnamed protein product [Clonostachys byssicola]
MLGRDRSRTDNSRCNKRTRVAIACQRCKFRKQKCDGSQPVCRKCKDAAAECTYIIPNKPMPFGKNHYISSLEKRVAELESSIAESGKPSSPMGTSASAGSLITPQGVTQLHHQQIMSNVTEAALVLPNHKELQPADPIARSLVKLSTNMNGGCLGASTFTSVARMLGMLVDDLQESGSPGGVDSPASNVGTVDTVGVELGSLSDQTANRLLEGYMKDTGLRWPVLHSTWLRKLNAQRSSASASYKRFILYLVYAIGGRTLESMGDRGSYSPGRHYECAMQLFPSILRIRDVRQICALILMAIWGIRSSSGGDPWTYSRMAMTKAIDLGLHRQHLASKEDILTSQMKKRIFWSCYVFDRMFCIPIGRPFAIADADIDLELPLDVDEDCVDRNILERKQNQTSGGSDEPVTSLSLFVHIIKLRRIESEIQRDIYRVDRPVQLSEKLIRSYQAKLASWKDQIPADLGPHDYGGSASQLHEFMIYYNKALRLLFYVTLSDKYLGQIFLSEFMQACGNLGRYFKKLQQAQAGLTIITAQTVFLAGLNLIYCTLIASKSIMGLWTIDNINTCSTVLFVIAEREPYSKRYRDIFETVREHLLDPIIGRLPTRSRPISLASEMRSTSGEGHGRQIEHLTDRLHSDQDLASAIGNDTREHEEAADEFLRSGDWPIDNRLLTMASTSDGEGFRQSTEDQLPNYLGSLETLMEDAGNGVENQNMWFPFNTFDQQEHSYLLGGWDNL